MKRKITHKSFIRNGEYAKGLSLKSLADEINREHHEVEQALNKGLAHAFCAGELLLEAKSRCGHGGWLTWLKENFQGSARTAQAYMQVAKHRGEIEAKSQGIAHLGFQEALRLASEPKPISWIEKYCEDVDKDFLATIPELSPDVMLRGFEENNQDCMVEIFPHPDHTGYYQLYVYRELNDSSTKPYDACRHRGCKYTREFIAATLEKYHRIKPTIWGKYPALTNIPLLDELDKLDGGDDDKAC